MSSLIEQAQAPAVLGPTAVQRTNATQRSMASQEGAKSTSQAQSSEAVSLDTTPSSPPPEVLAQMQQAAETYEDLEAQGYEIHFSEAQGSGKVTAELRDSEGNVVRTLTASEAIELATGTSPTE